MQIHLTTEVRKEQTAFHSPVTTLHDKSASSDIVQKKRKTIIGVIAVSNNFRIHINTMPFLAGSIGVCLCCLPSFLSKRNPLAKQDDHENNYYSDAFHIVTC